MAIFGSLQDMPVPDVLGMLGQRHGILEIRFPDGATTMDVVLGDGRIRQIQRNETPLDPLQARTHLPRLLALRDGDFEFVIDSAKLAEPPRLDWPVDRVLLSMAMSDRDRQIMADALPHPMVRFQSTASDVALAEPLKTFWSTAAPRLAVGASAQELAQGLGLSLAQTRYFLYQLRVANYIAPKRAFQAEPVSQERKSFAGRLLGALFRRGK
jgi:hypothetical protein